MASEFASNAKDCSRTPTASSASELRDDSVSLSDSAPSHGTLPISGFCDRCRAIIIDVEKHTLGTTVLDNGEVVLEPPADVELELDFELEDTYPNFPHLTTSAARGCGFCDFLKEQLLEEIPKALTKMSEDMQGQAFKVEIHGCIYVWERKERFSKGEPVDRLAELWATIIISNSRRECARSTLYFAIMADSETAVSRFLRIVRRPVEANILNPRTMRLCLQWLSVCAGEHAACKVPKTPFVPTRLIDVGDASYPDSPRLISTNQEPWGADHRTGSDLPEQSLRNLVTRYLAFSYCWGPLRSRAIHFRTTKENVHQRRSGISLDALPQSFLDLFAVARELGLRHVWIDSLCIVQDDPEDLAREIGKMGEVYGRAYLTVASALDTSSSNSLFHVRNQNQRIFEVPFVTSAGGSITGSYSLLRREPNHRDPFTRDAEDSTYNRRGWTFQERFLSRRVLYLCATVLYYECQELGCSEDSIATYRRYQWPRWCPTQELESSGSESLYKTWYTFVRAYCPRQLTYKGDKLPAVAGLAATMGNALQASGIQDTYLAGLWKHDLMKGLLWARGLAHNLWRTLDYRAPSWCWSAFDGKIEYPLHLVQRRMESRCRIIDVAVQSKDPHPFGCVTGGHLRVKGRLNHIDSVQVTGRDRSTRKRYLEYYLFLKDDRVVAIGTLDVSGRCGCIDCEQRQSSGEYRELEVERDVWILLLANAHLDDARPHKSRPLESWPVGLVLTLTESLTAEAEYRRIGIFWINVQRDGTPLQGDPTIFDTCEEETITIV